MTQTESQRRHYEANRALYAERSQVWRKARKRALSQRTLDYLRANPCLDCGEADPVVLEFDHVRGEKVESISMLIASACSFDKLDTEIAKCEVRCANCHRRRTAHARGWFRSHGGE